MKVFEEKSLKNQRTFSEISLFNSANKLRRRFAPIKQSALSISLLAIGSK